MTDWIDVRERLPECETEVNVATKNNTVTSAYLVKTYEGDRFFKDGVRLDVAITHWMDLPEPPK